MNVQLDTDFAKLGKALAAEILGRMSPCFPVLMTSYDHLKSLAEKEYPA